MTEEKAKPRSGIDPAVPFQLAELVEYGEGAVVSRTIAKSKAGTMTVFAFDAGEELSEHTAPFDAFVHILDGEAKLTIDGQDVIAKTGQIVLMPAKIPHAVHAASRFKMLLVLIRG